MYKVYLDGQMIYNPGSEDLVLINPKLDLELNAPGQFTCTMLENHPYYDTPKRMLSRVDVYRNDELLFRGRVIDESIDFYKRKTLTCEGELAFLNDSIQRPAEYHDMTVREYLQTLIASHNEQVEEDKQFTVGTVTVTDSNDSLFRYTNNNSTMTEIKEDLIDDLGGYLRVRNQNGIRYLDYLEIVDYGITNDNAIRFGTNLLDFTQDMDVTDIATVIIPLGERLEESPIEALDMRLTIESVNNGKDWIQSDEAVETYGRITKVVTWDDVTQADNLLSKGQRWLSDTQWDAVELTAKAIDMNLTDAEMDAFHLGDQLRVTSQPHGLDRYFPLSKMSLVLDAPESNSYTLGLVTTPSLIGQLVTQSDLSSQLGNVSARVSSLTGEVDEKASEVLQEARDNATQLITSATTEMQAYSDALNEATANYAKALAEGNEALAAQYAKEMEEYAEKLVASATACGHVVIEAPYDEILIMDTEDKNTAQRVWRWNLNGLGYSKTGYNGEYGLAMTMDGAIVADYITTGTLSADRIRGGTLILGGMNGVNGSEVLYNSNNEKILSIDEDGVFTTDPDSGAWARFSYGMTEQSDGDIYGVRIEGSMVSFNYAPNYSLERAKDYIWWEPRRIGYIDSLYSSGTCSLELHSEFIFLTEDSGGIGIGPKGNNPAVINRTLTVTGGAIMYDGSWDTASDQILKNDIKPLQVEIETFIDKIQPISYCYKDDESQKTHFGVTYQNIKEALESEGVNPEKYAVANTAKDTEGKEIGTVAYDELIAPLIYEVKNLKQEVQDLKSQVKELERKVTT